jgi:hypothetical protein
MKELAKVYLFYGHLFNFLKNVVMNIINHPNNHHGLLSILYFYIYPNTN